MSKELISVDWASLAKTEFEWDGEPWAESSKLTIRNAQDCEHIVERNKLLRSESRGPKEKVNFHFVAHIPNLIWHDLVKRGIALDDAKLDRWLNDSDNEAWRTAPGKV